MSGYTRVLSSESLTDTSVYNESGDKLGDIEDIMIDLPTGTVAYAVLSFHHGFLNMSEKLFALPWEALTVDEENEQMILNVPKEKLEKAEGFDKDNWPDFADPTFQRNLYSYYGYSVSDRMAA